MRAAGLPTVVTNTSFRMAPWADVLFGFDARWWREHIDEVLRTFAGRRLLGWCDVHSARMPLECVHGSFWFTSFGNSGACAISIAVSFGAARVILLGFDGMRGPNGEAHWHGDHPKGFINCASMADWSYQFGQVAKFAADAGVLVINCSRRTAVKCFERGELSEVLQQEAATA